MAVQTWAVFTPWGVISNCPSSCLNPGNPHDTSLYLCETWRRRKLFCALLRLMEPRAATCWKKSDRIFQTCSSHSPKVQVIGLLGSDHKRSAVGELKVSKPPLSSLYNSGNEGPDEGRSCEENPLLLLLPPKSLISASSPQKTLFVFFLST